MSDKDCITVILGLCRFFHGESPNRCDNSQNQDDSDATSTPMSTADSDKEESDEHDAEKDESHEQDDEKDADEKEDDQNTDDKESE